MLQIFGIVNVTYRRNKNLKELISPSLFSRTIKATAQLKNVTGGVLFVIFSCDLLSILVMLPNANAK